MREFIERHKLAVILLMMGVQVVSLALDSYSLYDRYEIKRQAKLNRVMLDARARIQITIINTGRRRGAFTEDEIQSISADWNLAEYNKVLENPFR